MDSCSRDCLAFLFSVISSGARNLIHFKYKTWDSSHSSEMTYLFVMTQFPGREWQNENAEILDPSNPFCVGTNTTWSPWYLASNFAHDMEALRSKLRGRCSLLNSSWKIHSLRLRRYHLFIIFQQGGAMSEIIHVQAREILDSRGNPTVEVEVALISGIVGRA